MLNRITASRIVNESKTVEEWIKEGSIDVNDRDEKGRTPLHLAASSDVSGTIIQLLLKAGANKDAKLPVSSETPLSLAVQANNALAVKALIESKANLNLQDDRVFTPLHWAVLSDPTGGIMAQLVEAKADLDVQDNDGFTPLHLAVSHDLTGNMVKQLIDAKANLNVTAEDSNDTPLIVAIKNNNLKAIEHLINANVDLTTGDKDGLTALHWAAIKDKEGKIIKKLIEVGANKNAETLTQATPLMLAISAGNVAGVQEFLAENVDLNKLNNQYLSSYDMAILSRNSEIVKEISDAYRFYPRSETHEQIRFIKKIGHIMGLGMAQLGSPTHISIFSSDEPTKVISTEELLTHHTQDVLIELLEAYTKKLKAEEQKDRALDEKTALSSIMEKITEAYQFSARFINCDEKVTEDVLVKRYLSGNLLILPVDVQEDVDVDIAKDIKGHALGWSVDGDKLIYVNRGEGSRKEISIYQMTPDEHKAFQILLTQKETWELLFPNRLQTETPLTDDTLNEFLGTICANFKNKNPLYQCIQKDQRHGTCSLANRKSMIEPLLFLEKLKRLRSDVSVTVRDEKITELLLSAKKDYKEWTAFMRDECIKMLLDELEKSRSSDAESSQYSICMQLILAIIAEHHGQDSVEKRHEKRTDELNRILTILLRLTAEEQEIVLTSHLDLILAAAIKTANWKTVAFLLLAMQESQQRLITEPFLKEIQEHQKNILDNAIKIMQDEAMKDKFLIKTVRKENAFIPVLDAVSLDASAVPYTNRLFKSAPSTTNLEKIVEFFRKDIPEIKIESNPTAP